MKPSGAASGLRRLLAERERAVLRRLAELLGTFTATHAEKSLRVAEGVAQLHRLIGQLEAKCLPQVNAFLTQKLSQSAAYGVLNSPFSF